MDVHYFRCALLCLSTMVTAMQSFLGNVDVRFPHYFSIFSRFATVVKCMVTLAIFLTYFIQVYVPLEILEPWFLQHVFRGETMLKSFIFRALVVIFTGKCFIYD